MPRPTRKAFSLAAAALLLFFLAGSSQAGWLYVLASAFVGVLVAGLILPRRLIAQISAERKVPAVATAGDVVPIALTLSNNSRGRRGPFAGTDGLLSPQSFIVEALGPRESIHFSLKAKAVKRGVHRAGTLRLTTAAPFGTATAARALEPASPLTVHPRWVSVGSFPLLEATSTPQEALHDRRRSDSGTDFFGLRQYRPGDSLRGIHWPSSARHGDLLVREYEELIGTRLGILIDGGTLGTGPDTTFELALSCAASVLMYALDAGHPVQLFCDTPGGVAHLFEPSKGEALDWMAGLDEGGGGGLVDLAGFASAHIFRRSTNVLVFPTTHKAAQQAADAVVSFQNLGTRVIVIVVSARSFATGPGVLDEAQEQRLVRRLLAMRVIVYRAECGGDLAECLREPAS